LMVLVAAKEQHRRAEWAKDPVKVVEKWMGRAMVSVGGCKGRDVSQTDSVHGQSKPRGCRLQAAASSKAAGQATLRPGQGTVWFRGVSPASTPLGGGPDAT
jgi:hypothetical protein